jgi:hypothetical protein
MFDGVSIISFVLCQQFCEAPPESLLEELWLGEDAAVVFGAFNLPVESGPPAFKASHSACVEQA